MYIFFLTLFLKELDEKLSEFWNYIDSCKFMDKLTNAFLELYNEPVKPANVKIFIFSLLIFKINDLFPYCLRTKILKVNKK